MKYRRKERADFREETVLLLGVLVVRCNLRRRWFGFLR
jgi:hypothetical protein